MKSVNAKINNGILDLSRRGSGVLLHVTSLPGKYGIGDLGPAAFEWVNLLKSAGQRWWQMLPLGPCGEGYSPYRSYSAFAGNPLLISPDHLFQQGLVSRSDLNASLLPPGNVNFAAATKNKIRLLTIAFESFSRLPSGQLSQPMNQFVSAESAWLDDFALFMALRETHPSISWTRWPKPIVLRIPSALREARIKLSRQISFHQFVQFLFFDQLHALRKHAARAGVALIGDLPIFVSPESADVWCHPKLFQLDRNMNPTAVAGVPPDAFSATGQRWGNPLYNWKHMRKDRFTWWKDRLAAALRQADLVRIDHFRGFESYWSIPASAPTAETGKWIKAPGDALFSALLENDAKLPLLAEDLGIITPQVQALRDRFDLPGMRVLQFGLNGEPANPHSPHNFIPHCFAYSGTHDNDTTIGWYRALPTAARRQLQQYAPGFDWNSSANWSLIQILIASSANHAIVPLQDLLGLGNKARMNTPGQATGNWAWRTPNFSICRKPLAQLHQLCTLYNRTTIHAMP